MQDSLKVELGLAEARLDSSRRKIEAELQMEAEQQVCVVNYLQLFDFLQSAIAITTLLHLL